MENLYLPAFIAVAGIVAIIIGIAIYRSVDKKEKAVAPAKKIATLQELIAGVKNQALGLEKLEVFVSDFIASYADFSQDKAAKLEFMTHVASHKSATSKLILGLDKTLKALNPGSTKEIDYATKLGLDARK